MDRLTRRSILRASAGLAAVGAIARPFVATAETKTATVWWVQGFAEARKIDRLVGLSISSLPCSKRRAAACSVYPWFGRVCAVRRGGSIVDHRPRTPGRLKCHLSHSRATFEALIGHPLLSYRAFAEGGSRELVSGTGPYPSRVSLTDNPTHPDLPEGVSADRLLP